jgi:hypothetical protein
MNDRSQTEAVKVIHERNLFYQSPWKTQHKSLSSTIILLDYTTFTLIDEKVTLSNKPLAKHEVVVKIDVTS